MEIYDGKPIFYSLGNFIAQNDLVYKLPADSFERFRVDPSKTPSQVMASRSADGTRGFPADSRYWETVVPTCYFRDGQLRGIELLPVTLQHGRPVHQRGRPLVAGGEHGHRILSRFAALSKPYGTTLEIDGDRAIVPIG
jgi:poly-gamma-glutamate synthesis protein (capsule biosynthesis protein)